VTDTFLSLLLSALAGNGVAYMIARLEGPGDCFVRLRTWAGAYDPDQYGNLPWHGRFITCPYCLTTWLIPLALLFWAWPLDGAFLVYWATSVGLGFFLLQIGGV